MNELIGLIEANQNCNGGGLAVAVTGQYVSNRHALATMDCDKLTAGQMSKKLSKLAGKKISARELVELYRIKVGEPEWHHAGFIPGQKRMARTYFFEVTEIESLTELVKNADAIFAERDKKDAQPVTGFYYVWDYDYNGNRFGKKRNFKVLRAFKGIERDKPSKNFTECSEDDYLKFKAIEGKCYYGWDEPGFKDIR